MVESLLNNPNLIVPCGLYCGECSGFQEKKCGGCLSRKGLCLKYTKTCQIYSCCVDEKKRRFCSECSDFPCEKFDKFFNTSQWHNEVVGNLKRIKKLGVKKFLKEQVRRVKKLIKCAEERGIKHCRQCQSWPCRNLKRSPLVPE